MNFYLRRMVRMSTFDGLVECLMLNEGLITSYDIQKLQKHLKQKLGDKIVIFNPSEKQFKNNNFDYHAYTFIINLSDETIKPQIEKILDVFGYYINQENTNKHGVIKYNIEPRYPIKVNDVLKKNNIKFLYHITPKKHLPKIQKLGLAPRGSETTFRHPDDRIYLVNGPELAVKQLRLNLADNKHLVADDMAVLQIPYNDKYDYYLDDVATQNDLNLIAVFVLKNIPHSELSIVNL